MEVIPCLNAPDERYRGAAENGRVDAQVFAWKTIRRTATKPHVVTNGIVTSLAMTGTTIVESSQIIVVERASETRLIPTKRPNCAAGTSS